MVPARPDIHIASPGRRETTADRSQHLEHERWWRGDLDGDRPDVDPVQGALQISVSGWKAAQANQKWSPWTTGSSWEPASGPEVA